MANTHDSGDDIEITATFTQSGSVLDPSTVAITIRTPDGQRTTYTYGTDAEVTRTSEGIYVMTFPAVQVGRHHYRWVSTGTGKGAAEDYFDVRPIAVNV